MGGSTPDWRDLFEANEMRRGAANTASFIDLLNQEKRRQTDDELEDQLMPASDGWRYADGWRRSLISGRWYQSVDKSRLL